MSKRKEEVGVIRLGKDYFSEKMQKMRAREILSLMDSGYFLQVKEKTSHGFYCIRLVLPFPHMRKISGKWNYCDSVHVPILSFKKGEKLAAWQILLCAKNAKKGLRSLVNDVVMGKRQ